MSYELRREAVLSFLAIAALSLPAAAQTFSPDDLARRTVERRGVEAVIWGMPAVNFELMYDGLVAAKGTWNQVVYWSRLPDWKNQTLTPNPGTVYFQVFYNTKDGPVILEIPPAVDGSIVGSIDDGWQTALEDVGPAGADKGKGGKYLILPPGHKGDAPSGYVALPSSTYTGFALLRSNLKSSSDADVAKAVSYGKRVELYPLAQAAQPPPTKFVDAIDIVFDATIPYDLHFFERLDRFIQREPWLERDKAMIDALKSIGIEKGRPFKPDAETQTALKAAAAEAHAWLDAAYETVFIPPYFERSHWALPASRELIDAMSSNFAKPDSYPVDARGVTYTFAFFSAKHLGEGQFYLMAIEDKAGKPLDGAATYRLRVPKKAPVKLYWSATVYDLATHAFIKGSKVTQRSSLEPGLKKNADGSVDLWFAPQAPAGKESNWVPTKAGGTFEVLFRFYGPEKPLFEKKWKLPDIEPASPSGTR